MVFLLCPIEGHAQVRMHHKSEKSFAVDEGGRQRHSLLKRQSFRVEIPTPVLDKVLQTESTRRISCKGGQLIQFYIKWTK
jgi:hypothetical protein